MKIVFNADAQVAYKGFKMSWSLEDIPTTTTQTTTTTSTTTPPTTTPHCKSVQDSYYFTHFLPH